MIRLPDMNYVRRIAAKAARWRIKRGLDPKAKTVVDLKP